MYSHVYEQIQNQSFVFICKIAFTNLYFSEIQLYIYMYNSQIRQDLACFWETKLVFNLFMCRICLEESWMTKALLCRSKKVCSDVLYFDWVLWENLLKHFKQHFCQLCINWKNLWDVAKNVVMIFRWWWLWVYCVRTNVYCVICHFPNILFLLQASLGPIVFN